MTTYEKPSTLKRRWLDLLIDVIEDMASIFTKHSIAQYAKKSMKIGFFQTPTPWKLIDGLVLQRTLWNSDPILYAQESKIVAAYSKATLCFGATKTQHQSVRRWQPSVRRSVRQCQTPCSTGVGQTK